MAGLGIGLAVGLGPPPGGGVAGAPNPNLLLWTDDFSQASVWTLSNCVDLGPTGGGHEIASTGADAFLRQIAAVVVAAGSAAVTTAVIGDLAARFTITGTFDGLPYTLSCKLRDLSGGDGNANLGLRLDRFGGGLRCQIEDVLGTADYEISEAQLEQAASFTTYHSRGGS